jgi:K+-sensing histidine kinase KdpD
MSIEPELLISIDTNYMSQVIDHLVINAINFTKKGIIRIFVKGSRKSIKLTIYDQGEQIPKHQHNIVFRPIKNMDDKSPLDSGRTSGLSLCKKLLEAHGGSIMMTNLRIRGVKIQCTLPIE